jgi:coproporphyrinogen III oxidase-like Fe-S oxidoreductase
MLENKIGIIVAEAVTDAQFLQTLNQVARMDPDHITVLSVLPNDATRRAEWPKWERTLEAMRGHQYAATQVASAAEASQSQQYAAVVFAQ